MAEDTINAAQKAFGVPVTESPTRTHVLYGGDGFTGDLWEKLAAAFPIAKETAHHLAAKFGTTYVTRNTIRPITRQIRTVG